MKKLLPGLCVVLSVMLSGCESSESFQETEVNPMDLPAVNQWPIQLAPYLDGFYEMNASSYRLLYYEHGSRQVFVNETAWRNDKPMSLGGDNDLEKLIYMDVALERYMQLYDDHILYFSNYFNADGENSYRLTSVDLDGSNRKAIMKLDYEPAYGLVHKNRILITHQENDGMSLTVYDLKGHSLFERHINGYYSLPVADGDCFYYSCPSDESSTQYISYRLNITKMEEERICEGILGFANKGCVSIAENQNGVNTANRILDADKNVIFETDADRMIKYFDDAYVYVVNKQEQEPVFEVCSYDGTIITRILPSAWTDQPLIPDILRVINGKIIGGYYEEEQDENGNSHMVSRYLSCDIADGACTVLN